MNSWLLIGFWVAAGLDGYTTARAIKTGKLKEGWAPTAWLLDKIPGDSDVEYFFVKVLAFGLLITGEPPWWAWVAVIVLQLALAYNNDRLYRKLRL